MTIKQELKRLFTPKKLWILRLYVSLLTFLAEALLTIYIGLSLYNTVTSKSVLGNFVLGLTGFYLVWVCVILLFVSQLVTLFLNIHDNIEDVRNKTVDPGFSINVEEDKEKNQSNAIRAIYTILLVTLSIVFSFVNLNRENTSAWSSTTNSSDLVSDEQLEFIEGFHDIVKSKFANYEVKTRELVEKHHFVVNWVGIIHKNQKQSRIGYYKGLYGSQHTIEFSEMIGAQLSGQFQTASKHVTLIIMDNSNLLNNVNNLDYVKFSGALSYSPSFQILLNLDKITSIGNSSAGDSGIQEEETSSMESKKESYNIGDEVDGGIVFWVDGTREHGLIADKTDLGNMEWDVAKQACQNKGNGWRLPTKDELQKLYDNRDKMPNLKSGDYWSSSENDDGRAWELSFYNGFFYESNKLNTPLVLAVRAF